MIHETADVQTKSIGNGTKIWQFSIILQGAIIGSNCNINCHTFIENDVIIGNNVTIKSGVYLWDGTRIEDDVFIGPNATFINNPYARSKIYPDNHIGSIIKKGSTIGANSTIMNNLVIGEYAFIGAGSVLTKNVPPYQVWFGNPASHRGYIEKNGTLIDLNLFSNDGSKYKYENLNLIKISD